MSSSRRNFRATLPDVSHLDSRISKMAETGNKEDQEILIRNLDEQYKICKYCFVAVAG